MHRLLTALVFCFHESLDSDPMISNPVKPLRFIDFIGRKALFITENGFVLLCVQSNIDSNCTTFSTDF